MFPVQLLFAVLVSSVLSYAGGQSNGVCYMTVVETSTISVSVVVSNVQYYYCNWWSWSTCSRIEYSTQQVYTTISQNRSQFACCDGYLQIGTSQSCRSNTTSGVAIPQLNTVAVNTTGNSTSSLHAMWSLSNQSSVNVSFNASCTTQDGSHRVEYSVGQSLNATFSELMPSTYYTCCVWAVVAGNAGPPTCAVRTQTKGPCDGFSNSSSCLNGSVCLKYYYNTTIMNCLCQLCRIEYVANETARAADSGDSNSWAAPLVAALATIIVVMVTVAVVALLAHLVYTKARQRSSLQDETKANASPSFELHHTTNETQHEHCDATPLESEYTYVSTPECTGDKHTTVYADASESHSKPRTEVENSVHHKFTGSTVHLIKDEESRTAEELDYSTLDHTQDVAESPDRYNRVTHHAAKNQSDEVYSALNEGSERDLKVTEGYGILRGPIPKNTVNSNTSDDMYSSLLESNKSMQNNPLYLMKEE